MNTEFVDLAGVQKRCDESRATQHEDVLAFLGAQAPGKFLERLFHEFKPLDRVLWRLAREDVMLNPAEHSRRGLAFLDELDGHVISLSSQENRIDRFPKLSHAVVVLRPRTIEPINCAVFARDET